MNISVHNLNKDGAIKSEPFRVRRWHVVSGLCLFHGYRKGAELGVSTGRFTSFLCATIQDMQMLAVDLWKEQPEGRGELAQTYKGWAHDEYYGVFRQNCELLFPGRVTIQRMDTVEAAKFVEDGSLDFAFIDADHSYEGCKRDIEAWLPKVRPGGMLCGHDYNWPTVKQAVDERFKRVATASDNVWIHMVPSCR